MRGGGALRPAHAEGASGGAGRKGRWGQSPKNGFRTPSGLEGSWLLPEPSATQRVSFTQPRGRGRVVTAAVRTRPSQRTWGTRPRASRKTRAACPVPAAAAPGVALGPDSCRRSPGGGPCPAEPAGTAVRPAWHWRSAPSWPDGPAAGSPFRAASGRRRSFGTKRGASIPSRPRRCHRGAPRSRPPTLCSPPPPRSPPALRGLSLWHFLSCPYSCLIFPTRVYLRF